MNITSNIDDLLAQLLNVHADMSLSSEAQAYARDAYFTIVFARHNFRLGRCDETHLNDVVKRTMQGIEDYLNLCG